ncbi:hypothetical protein L596_021835 [Steinernema carpocapsae]|uniref:RING-CH-type domain-containing protein n=1 Tax=Steinernema carpocapsae TaxID=34508 RepID=A0A4V6A025_STECR|nr:hypothetical protein L596_021835 [Steinernema carpocapsae]
MDRTICKSVTQISHFDPSPLPMHSLCFCSPAMMVSSVPECRICYGLSSPESPLLEPCLCSGTLQFVHESCIVRFHVLNPEKPLACDVCKYCYDVKQTKELQAHRIRNIYRNLAKIGASTFAMHYTLSLNCCFHFVHSDLALIFSNFVWPLLAFDLLRFWYNYEAVDQLFWLAGQDAKEM